MLLEHVSKLTHIQTKGSLNNFLIYTSLFIEESNGTEAKCEDVSSTIPSESATKYYSVSKMPIPFIIYLSLNT